MEFTYLVFYISIILYVIFFTVIEHKLLASIQFRCGPNRRGLNGLLNSICDRIKLLQKDIKLENRRRWLYIFPWSGLLLTFILITCPTYIGVPEVHYIGIFIFFVVVVRLVYPLLGIRICSSRKYALLGSLRGVAQIVSYDMVLLVLIIFFIARNPGLSIGDFYGISGVSWIFNIYPAGIWFLVRLAESHRSPLDLSERESEVASGFLREFRGVRFLTTVLYEYIIIIIFRYAIICLFFIDKISLFSWFIITIALYMYIWVRASSPRCRYDRLIYLAWQFSVPVLLVYGIVLCSF